MHKSGYNTQEFINGFKEVLPLAIGAGIYGLAFGLLAAQAHMDGLQVGIMGTTVFAGASQIIVVERIVSGGGALVAIIAGAVLNLRLLLITASIRDVYAGRPFWQVVLGAHLTTDENWALMLAAQAEGRAAGYWYLVGAGLMMLMVWLMATIAGVTFATAIPEPRALGTDFAFTAAFIAIARSLWTGHQDLIPWVTSFVVAALLIVPGLVDGSWVMIVGAFAGAMVAGLRRNG